MLSIISFVVKLKQYLYTFYYTCAVLYLLASVHLFTLNWWSNKFFDTGKIEYFVRIVEMRCKIWVWYGRSWVCNLIHEAVFASKLFQSLFIGSRGICMIIFYSNTVHVIQTNVLLVCWNFTIQITILTPHA